LTSINYGSVLWLLGKCFITIGVFLALQSVRQAGKPIHAIIHYFTSILSPLSDARIQQGVEMVCCNENVQSCVPKLSAWLADHMENVMIHSITSNHCPICIALPDKFVELQMLHMIPDHTSGMLLLITIPTLNNWNLTASKM